MTTKKILDTTLKEAFSFLDKIDSIQPNIPFNKEINQELTDKGLGFEETLKRFKNQYEPYISGTAGPRYFGYVVGGATPASIAGDWLTSVYDQVSPASQVASVHEKNTITLLLELFNLPKNFTGTLVSGATVSNMLNLAIARQWYGLQLGIDITKNGMYGLKKMNVLSANAHSSSYKGLSILGIGRDSLIKVKTLPNSERTDIIDLERNLKALNGEPAIILTSAGTVNTTAFDDFKAIEILKTKYTFWHHIDAAFGGLASCTDNYSHLVNGWELADSITIDAHKWMNIPYDSAFQFTKRIDLQQQVFQNGNAPYIKDLGDFSLINLTPQASRRWRSLPVWFSLLTYGKKGYNNFIEKNCKQAKILGDFINKSENFELLAEVNLNTVCFKVSDKKTKTTEDFLKELNDSGKVFLTPTDYEGSYAIRCAICNWKTTTADIELLIKEMKTINL